MRLALIVSVMLVGCVMQQQDPTPACGPGTVDQNGVCVSPWTPPPGRNLGTGATVYVWASASAGAVAVGKVYVMVDDSTQGTLSGYATNGTPSCGFNAIYGVIVSVAPGMPYTISARDEENTVWPDYTTPTLTAGQCFSFRLN
jgi:hypothetical protein